MSGGAVALRAERRALERCGAWQREEKGKEEDDEEG
jgi:hypothetical protein